MSASDNPPILSGEKGSGGVALLWNLSLDDFITPLSKIKSDRIVGINCSFPGVSPFFVLNIHLPLANHPAEEFQEYFDYLWALYESLSVQEYTILMGDFNCHLGNSMGDRAPYEPNHRGLKLAEFANYFNLCPVNLLKQCSGPVYTYYSYCGRYRSTIITSFYQIVYLITLSQSINHMLESGSKVLAVFLTSVKLLIRFGLMGYCISCLQNLELKTKCG